MSDLFNGEPFRLIIDEDDPKDIKFGNQGLDDAKYVRTLSLNRASFKIIYRSSEAPYDKAPYKPLQIYFKYNSSDEWQLVYTHPWIAIDNYTGAGVVVETIDSVEEPIDGTIYKPKGPTFADIKGFDMFPYTGTTPVSQRNHHLNDSRVYYNNHIASYMYSKLQFVPAETRYIAYLYKEINNNVLTLEDVKQLFGTAGLEQIKNYGPIMLYLYPEYLFPRSLDIKYTNNLYNKETTLSLINNDGTYNYNLKESNYENTTYIDDITNLPISFDTISKPLGGETLWYETPYDINPSSCDTSKMYKVFVSKKYVDNLPDNPDINYVYRYNSKWWHYNGISWDEVNEFRLWYYTQKIEDDIITYYWKAIDIPDCEYCIVGNYNNESHIIYFNQDISSYNPNNGIIIPTEENTYDTYITDEDEPYSYPKFKTTSLPLDTSLDYDSIELNNIMLDNVYYITFPDAPSTVLNDDSDYYKYYPLRLCDSYFKGIITSAILWKIKDAINFTIPESDYSYIWSKKYELNFHHTNDTTITKSYKFYVVVDSLTRNDTKFTIDLSDDNRYIELLNTQTTLRNELYLPVDTTYSVHIEIPDELLYTYKLVGVSGWSGTANSSSADVNSKIHYNFALTYAYDPIYVDLNLVNNTNIHYIKRSTDTETTVSTKTTSQSYQLDFRCSESYNDYYVQGKTTTRGYYNKVTIKRLQYGTTYSKDMVLYESAKMSISDDSYASFENVEILLDISFTLDAQDEYIYLLYTNATSVILSKGNDEFTLTLEQTSVLLFSDTQYDAYLYCYAIVQNGYITGLRFFLDAEQYHHTDSYNICIPDIFGAVPGEHWVLSNDIVRPEPEILSVQTITVDQYNTDVSVNLSTDNKQRAVELNVTISDYSVSFTVYNDSDSQHHKIYSVGNDELFYYVEYDNDGFITTLHFYGYFDQDEGQFIFNPIITIR